MLAKRLRRIDITAAKIKPDNAKRLKIILFPLLESMLLTTIIKARNALDQIGI